MQGQLPNGTLDDFVRSALFLVHSCPDVPMPDKKDLEFVKLYAKSKIGDAKKLLADFYGYLAAYAKYYLNNNQNRKL